MGVTDFFAGEIATELLKMLITISRKSLLCKTSADTLITNINNLLPIIQEIKHSGVELPALRQAQLDRLSETLREGHELANKILASNRWNAYKNLQLARKMEKLEKNVSRFLNGPLQAHVLADVHHLRFETAERFDRLDGSARRLEQRLGAMKIGAGSGGWMEDAVKRVEVEHERWEGSLVNLLGVGMEIGKRKVKEMIIGRDDLGVVGICGIGGSGKTTLVNEICRDDQVRSYFQSRILFLTVSQSPNVEQLKAKIWRFVSGNDDVDGDVNSLMPNWNPPKFEWRFGGRKLVVLDDVWSISVLEELTLKVAGCKTLVVSRFKFASVISASYQVELLRGDEAISMFCLSAFGQQSIPLSADANLVKQIVNECKGLPLALKVIGSALRGQPEMYWLSAKKRLLRSEPICESHENKLLDRMALSINFLPKKVRECFLDLGCFPEDKKIPLDVLINMWVEIHDLDDEEAFAILVELSDKNLLTLVKDSRGGDLYSSYYDISITQHDVLRDLAIHLTNRGDVSERRRLLMPRRDAEIPKEWDRNAHQPFNAQIVSVHTGEMKEMDWFRMNFPKAEVLIINFSANEYFLPPFIDDMPKLRALIVINHSTSNATVHNFVTFSNLTNLRSLWLEKVSISHTELYRNLRKISFILCKINNSLDEADTLFPSLLELTIDHCDDLIKLPPSISKIQSLKILSITNCHNLQELAADSGNLKCLQILRLYACPTLKMLPSSICELVWLKYLDISQCVNLKRLPEKIGKMTRLEKIDMRECPQIWNVPQSVEFLECLRCVICDEEVSWSWKDLRKDNNVHVEVAERHFSLDWLDE
ncbi:probable disease resistance protein At4g33300 [Mercurialis annua]|uniref:probable disease resistance protein At4g33300 n=1 Tax=Mercurialis annua TaxID=3986 RepID=UPI00215FED99|nr:probable disease resistance protein At4g33300 [Mercurialis annua]